MIFEKRTWKEGKGKIFQRTPPHALEDEKKLSQHQHQHENELILYRLRVRAFHQSGIYARKATERQAEGRKTVHASLFSTICWNNHFRNWIRESIYQLICCWKDSSLMFSALRQRQMAQNGFFSPFFFLLVARTHTHTQEENSKMSATRDFVVIEVLTRPLA